MPALQYIMLWGGGRQKYIALVFSVIHVHVVQAKPEQMDEQIDGGQTR